MKKNTRRPAKVATLAKIAATEEACTKRIIEATAPAIDLEEFDRIRIQAVRSHHAFDFLPPILRYMLHGTPAGFRRELLNAYFGLTSGFKYSRVGHRHVFSIDTREVGYFDNEEEFRKWKKEHKTSCQSNVRG